ncbi:MAG: acyltransferase [Solirubrobacterales bacterium]|nr:acyltransferase [Solirubrobacterales bacterium]
MPSIHDRLTALDGTFLELEDADSCAHMHLGAVLVFGPRPAGGTPTVDELRAQLEERLHALPRYRQRLEGPSAGSLTWRRWIDDPHFDVARHVISARLPQPGGWDELLDWAGEYYSRRLERSLPLWQIAVVDGLADGHWALVTKTHHCLVDGVGAVQAGHLLLDGIGDALAGAPAPAQAGTAGTPGRLDRAVRALRGPARAAVHPRETLRRADALAELLVTQELIAAPATSINAPIGARRILRGVTVDLGEVRQITGRLGGTVNDVVLAAACTGLRELLLSREEPLPDRGLRAMVPMSVRTDESPGNHISSLFVELPVGVANPLVRYELIRTGTAAVKRSTQPLGTDTLLALGALAPPVLHRVLARSLFAKRLFNVTITNVPGVPVPLTAFGAPLEAIWPLVPIAADHTVALAILSYDGRLMIGICADRDATPDVDVLAAGVTTGLAELQRLAPRVDAPREAALPA